jgi:predicted nucleotidyltransferase
MAADNRDSVWRMREALRRVLEREPAVLYALLFGSAARGTLRADSDVDVALELSADASRTSYAFGRLVSRLESAAARPVDLVLLDEAPAPLAYRIFRDGDVLLERDHAALVARKARAIIEYLDWKPVEDRLAAGVLRAAARRGR